MAARVRGPGRGAATAPVTRADPTCWSRRRPIPDVDIVVNAVVGAAGLDATLAALRAGKRVALANKETLVMAGELVAQAACAGGGELVPIDSEHSAVLQCVTGRDARARRGSSSPRRAARSATGPRSGCAQATVEEALQHPTWRMGSKITVDSATLANKALEVIEAHYLFGLSYDALDVVVHPQSIVHAFVEFCDGSVIAQLGFPSMELPILYALTHPGTAARRGRAPLRSGGGGTAHLRAGAGATCSAPSRAGVAAGRAGGTAPAVFNAANEVAVAAFLDGRGAVRPHQRDHRAGARRSRAGARARRSRPCATPIAGRAARARLRARS